MNRWTARLLACILTAGAAYLVYANVRAGSVLLECTLAAAILSIATVALAWRRPVAALVLNIAWLIGAFAGPYWLGHLLPNLTAIPPGTRSPIAAGESPQAVSVKLHSATNSAAPEDYVLAARAAKLPTIEAAFAYVRDDVGFESYEGILRGGKGTFYDRSGNSIDRAMLLAAILQIHKIPVRIATGQITQAQAEQLYARIFETVPSPKPSSQPDPMIQRVFDRAHRDYSTMMKALADAPPPVNVPSHDDVLKELEQHAWVQAQRNGQWIDLDPSFPGATVGHAYTAATQTFDSPPPALMQTVTMRIVKETVSNGALEKETVLEATLPAYQIIDKQIYLYHKPYQPFNGQGGQLQYIFGNKDTMQPVLMVAGRPIDGKPIDFGSGATPSGTSAPNAVQAAANAFGTPAPGANANAVAFVAEWLEFEIGFPDGHKSVTRRAIVDRAGTAWRHSTTHDPAALTDLARSNNELIAPQAIYNVWFSGGKHNALAFAMAAERLANGGIPYKDASAPTFDEQMWPFALRNLSWVIASDHIVVPAVNDTPGLRLYADSPRIFVWSIGPDPTGKSSEVVIQSDLRRDGLRAVAKDSSTQMAIAPHKVLFGALEGALEHELSAPPQPDATTEYVTTSSLADGGDVTVLLPGATVSASDPETRARLQTVLANGDTAIVPKRVLAGGPSGWWQISHGTGDVRAVLDDDLGGSYTKGGFPKKVNPGGSPKGQNVNWNGEVQAYEADLETEFEPMEEMYRQWVISVELGGDRLTSGQVVQKAGPSFVKVAAYTGAAVVVAAVVIAYAVMS